MDCKTLDRANKRLAQQHEEFERLRETVSSQRDELVQRRLRIEALENQLANRMDLTGRELDEAERQRAEALEALWEIKRILQGAVETLTPKEQAALARAKRAPEEAN